MVEPGFGASDLGQANGLDQTSFTKKNSLRLQCNKMIDAYVEADTFILFFFSFLFSFSSFATKTEYHY